MLLPKSTSQGCMVQQRQVATALQLLTSSKMQLGDSQGTVENGTVAKANSSVCAKAEEKLLKLVSLIHRCITGVFGTAEPLMHTVEALWLHACH